ncbi:MAG: LysM peptidoglycan-binding domain-containing protein, partial [Deltaproteobacteria bacterium]
MFRAAGVLWVASLAACVTVRAPSRTAVPKCPEPGALAATRAAASEEAEEEDGDEIHDEVTDDGASGELPPPAPPRPHPLAGLSDAELDRRVAEDLASLGPISVGRPNAGALVNGVQMPPSPEWEIVNPRETWGTPETIDALARAIRAVHARFPNTRPLPIGDISDRDGGPLAPHISHQSGRDVDVGYYYTTDDKWYTTANGDNLDLPRTWAFVRALVTETDVEVIFIDRRIQKLLRAYAESIGEDTGWLDQLFGGPTSRMRPLIRHEKGHRTHIHVRFYNPIAQESGRRLYRSLLAHKVIKPPTYYVKYKARRGDTLLRIARKFHTSVKAIKRANRLRSNRIFATRVYRIPRRGGVAPPAKPLAIPARRLPPPRGTAAVATARPAQPLQAEPAPAG